MKESNAMNIEQSPKKVFGRRGGRGEERERVCVWKERGEKETKKESISSLF
jgi:hypothetical protein